MGFVDDILKLTKLKAKRAKEDIHKYVKAELKKEEGREKVRKKQ